MKSKDIWVGENSVGTMWVYDPDMPHENTAMIYLYSVKENKLTEKTRVQARKVLSSTKTPKLELAISQYLRWKSAHATTALKELREKNRELEEKNRELQEKKKREAEQHRAEAIERHKAYLKRHGKPYSGVTQNSRRKRRAPFCWSCHEHLDSDLHIECNSCGWLICYCGACGCAYEGLY